MTMRLNLVDYYPPSLMYYKRSTIFIPWEFLILQTSWEWIELLLLGIYRYEKRQGFIEISQGKDHRIRIVTATQKGRSAVSKAILLWNEVQHKVKQEMGENSWRELMQNLGDLLKVTEELTTR